MRWVCGVTKTKDLSVGVGKRGWGGGLCPPEMTGEADHQCPLSYCTRVERGTRVMWTPH